MASAVTRDRLSEIRAGTHAIVDLDAYHDNLRAIQRIGGSERSVMAVVKANAYGHGAIECAEAAVEAGCSYLGVARIDEAIQLRRAGITAPILVIGPPNMSQIGLALDNDIALTVATNESADAVLSAASNRSVRPTVHLKIDTGLHRYGATPDLALKLAAVLEEHPAIRLEGLYTHFSSADEEDTGPTIEQIDRFQTAHVAIREQGIDPPLVHVANSAGTILELFPDTNMVRAGIASYGLDPSDEVPVPETFRQIISLHTVLTRQFVLERGESVSYNRTYTASKDESVAAVPIGYADGIERHLSNTGWLVHRDGRCPIVGRVCMDQTVISVPESAREGDPVTVIGREGDGAMSVSVVGRLCGTNTYEPVSRIAARVPRIYMRAGEPYSWSVPFLCESGRF